MAVSGHDICCSQAISLEAAAYWQTVVLQLTSRTPLRKKLLASSGPLECGDPIEPVENREEFRFMDSFSRVIEHLEILLRHSGTLGFASHTTLRNNGIPLGFVGIRKNSGDLLGVSHIAYSCLVSCQIQF